jgi:hypothetical protein
MNLDMKRWSRLGAARLKVLARLAQLRNGADRIVVRDTSAATR